MIPGLLGTLSGGFTPLDYAGCRLWLDSAQIVGLTDGNAVAPWTDSSGVGNNATQSDADLKPIYKVASGRPYVQFDGSNDELALPSGIINGSEGFSVFFVAKQTVLGTGLYYTHNTVLQLEDYNYFGIGYGGRNICMLQSGAATNMTCYSDTGIWSSDTFGIDSTIYNGTLTGDAERLKKYFSGAQMTLTFDAAVPATIWSGGAVGKVGKGQNAFSVYLAGYLAEVLVYGATLTNIQRMSVERYLAQKWGITIDQSPVNTVAPAITADPGWTVGATATCTTGTWTNSPTSYTYQWQKKPDADWLDITSATSSSYTIQPGVVEIRCRVVASNAFATSSVATSNDETIA